VQSDALKQLSKTRAFNFDYIQWHLRTVAMRCAPPPASPSPCCGADCAADGAALVYTAPAPAVPTEARNATLVGEYVRHVLYGLPLKHEPNLVDADALFVPSGCVPVRGLCGCVCVC
jgi:hypothetical protein